MRLEVRCCCDPSVLLGFVDLLSDHVVEHQVVRFELRPTVSLKPSWAQKDGDLFSFQPSERLELPVGLVRGIDRRSGQYLNRLALKSNETPIETLRRIPGFREAS